MVTVELERGGEDEEDHQTEIDHGFWGTLYDSDPAGGDIRASPVNAKQ